MSYSRKIIEDAKKMRRMGFSLTEISVKFEISKSTASLWTSKEKVTIKGRQRIINRQNRARRKAFSVLEKKRSIVKNEIQKRAVFTLKKINLDNHLSKLLSSIFIWTEGEKGQFSRVGFANSDSQMISTFLSLLRRSFSLDEAKMRALVHIHEYHNENKILGFWSKITKIPISQFNKSYLKPHTGKRKREDYMGSIHITYFDYKVARELATIYNMFAQIFRGVG